MPRANKKEYSADEVKRYMGALVEHVDSGFQAINEQHVAFEEQYKGIERRLSAQEQILHTHTEMIGQLMIDVTDIKNNLKRKVDLDEFAKLERRVARLEARR